MIFLSELRCFFELHWAEGTVPGGVHFELTGDNVTECTGGARQLADEQLGEKYLTTCDPSLKCRAEPGNGISDCRDDPKLRNSRD